MTTPHKHTLFDKAIWDLFVEPGEILEIRILMVLHGSGGSVQKFPF